MFDIYFLDGNLTRLDLVEQYSDFVWADRYDEHGAFTMKIPVDSLNLQNIARASFVEFSESNYLMMVESIFYDRDAGEVTVTGDSCEAILKHRLVMSNWSSGEEHDEWRYSGRSALIASMLVDRFVISGADTISQDILPYTYRGQTATGGDTISVALKTQPLYDALKTICALDDLGFRFFFDKSARRLRFDIIKGVDRTSDNGVREAVIFSRDLDNLSKSTFLSSIADMKNTGYVLRNGKRVETVHDGASQSGWKRRVEAFDLSQYSSTQSVRVREIRSELSLKRKAEISDGQVEGNSNMFAYGAHFHIGDIVTIDSQDAPKSFDVRVSEYTYSYDVEGYRAFPSFRPFVSK